MKHCLIVDGSKVARLVARRVLEDLGFGVAEAEDGQGAMAACTTRLPDLMLTEWRLRDLDGLALLKALRGQTGGDGVKVIICTEVSNPDDIRMAVEAGADEYIMKPFDGEILRTKLALVGLP